MTKFYLDEEDYWGERKVSVVRAPCRVDGSAVGRIEKELANAPEELAVFQALMLELKQYREWNGDVL
jgi:hypothetical protein